MTNEELAAIRERVEKATEGNPLVNVDALIRREEVINEDIPKLLAEIERMREGNELIDLIEERLIVRGYSHADDRYDLFLREVYEILYEEDSE